MIDLGQNTVMLETSPAFDPFSRVTLIVGTDENGDEVSYTAGDDAGRELTAHLPWATQRIANNLLAQLVGLSYQPFVATNAILDPAAELGDAVSIDGVVSVLGSIATTFDALYTANIEAPQDEEIDHEYPYEPQPERTATRRAATVTAELSVLADTISSKISSTEAQTLITQSLNSITLSASAGSNQSTVTISADGIVVDSAVVQFSNIVADSIVANASISAPTIRGGEFCNSVRSHWLKIGYNSSAYFGNGLALYAGHYSTSEPLFSVYDNDLGSVVLRVGDSDIMTASDAGINYLFGTWDFATGAGPILLREGVHYGTQAQMNALTPTSGRVFFVRN